MDAQRLGGGLISFTISVPQSAAIPRFGCIGCTPMPTSLHGGSTSESDAGPEWSRVKYVINGHRSSGSIGADQGDSLEPPRIAQDNIVGFEWVWCERPHRRKPSRRTLRPDAANALRDL